MDWQVPVTLTASLLVIYILIATLRSRLPIDTDELVDTIDALLPQTQCANAATQDVDPTPKP